MNCSEKLKFACFLQEELEYEEKRLGFLLKLWNHQFINYLAYEKYLKFEKNPYKDLDSYIWSSSKENDLKFIRDNFGDGNATEDPWFSLINNVRNLYQNNPESVILPSFINGGHQTLKKSFFNLELAEISVRDVTSTLKNSTNYEYNSFQNILTCDYKKIVIQGDPGAGKSIQAKYFLHSWANNQWSSYDRLLLLFINFKLIEEDDDFFDTLLKQNFTNTPYMTKCLLMCVFWEQHEEIVLVLDGADERIQQDGILKSIIDCKIANHYPRTIIWTRKWMAQEIMHTCDICFEILGIGDGNLRTFLEKYYEIDDRDFRLFKQLFSNELSKIQEFCKIPLLALLIFYTWRNERNLVNTNIFDIYEKALQKIMDIPIDDHDIIKKFKKECFYQISHGKITLKLKKNELRIIEGYYKLISQIVRKKDDVYDIEFCHLSIQEHLAANYLLNRFHHSRKILFIRKRHKKEKHFRNIRSMNIYNVLFIVNEKDSNIFKRILSLHDNLRRLFHHDKSIEIYLSSRGFNEMKIEKTQLYNLTVTLLLENQGNYLKKLTFIDCFSDLNHLFQEIHVNCKKIRKLEIIKPRNKQQYALKKSSLPYLIHVTVISDLKYFQYANFSLRKLKRKKYGNLITIRYENLRYNAILNESHEEEIKKNIRSLMSQDIKARKLENFFFYHFLDYVTSNMIFVAGNFNDILSSIENSYKYFSRVKKMFINISVFNRTVKDNLQKIFQQLPQIMEVTLEIQDCNALSKFLTIISYIHNSYGKNSLSKVNFSKYSNENIQTKWLNIPDGKFKIKKLYKQINCLFVTKISEKFGEILFSNQNIFETRNGSLPKEYIGYFTSNFDDLFNGSKKYLIFKIVNYFKKICNRFELKFHFNKRKFIEKLTLKTIFKHKNLLDLYESHEKNVQIIKELIFKSNNFPKMSSSIFKVEFKLIQLEFQISISGLNLIYFLYNYSDNALQSDIYKFIENQESLQGVEILNLKNDVSYELTKLFSALSGRELRILSVKNCCLHQIANFGHLNNLLNNCSSLEVFNLSNNNIVENFNNICENLKNSEKSLKQINLSYCGLNTTNYQSILSLIKNCQFLEKLILSGNVFSDNEKYIMQTCSFSKAEIFFN